MPGAAASSRVPPLMALFSDQDTWSVTVKPDQPDMGTWIFAFGWLAAMGYFWSDKHPGYLDLVGVWLTAFTPLVFIKAAFQTLGKYVISSSGGTVRLFRGIGTLGYKREFSLNSLSQVRLRTQYVRHGMRKSISICADRTLCFGEEMSDEQRQYLANLLIQRARSTKRQ
uniref:Uncharacterized protein n=1 Tax=Solibacter usitatus (strain Ellin6076) TaxID=234267 RepID=Q01TR9_SOLUE